ncbi:MAG: hypothetical protein M3R38_31375 [Actinomycetota bacterium]|nr:hypothetical protein [Actinomycetota bacterium]MDP9480115.1 hypothetical protein [Actinomycetota bacterium]
MLRVRVAQGWERSTILVHMTDPVENCLHLGGLRIAAGPLYRCLVCGVSLDLEGVGRWVREAERARDEAYSIIEGDGFGEIVREELQREVYRRRRVMYELGNVPRVATARPEMLLIIHDEAKASYECRVFYKEPRPAGGVEEVSVGAVVEVMLELRSDPDPIVRLISEKVEEFHALRLELSEGGAPAPQRRVFYANEL